MFTLFLTRAAFATDTVTMCSKVETDFLDGAVGDRWTDTANRPARGFDAKVTDLTTGSPAWPTNGTWGSLGTSDADAGCVTLELVRNHSYRMEVRSRAVVDGHTIRSWGSEAAQDYATALPFVSYTVTGPVTVSGWALPGPTEPRWENLALAAFALKMYDGLLVNETFTLLSNDFSNTNTCGGGVNNTNLTTCDRRKFVLAHELGHTVTLRSDVITPGQATNKVVLQDTNGCFGGGAIKKQYAKTSFLEGMADVYAALVWNQLGANADCHWAFSNLDFNLNGVPERTPPDSTRCHGDPIDFATGPDPDDRDWLEDLVLADDDDEDEVQCTHTGPLTNRLTDYDVIRYAWSLLAEEGMTVTQLWEVWDDADIRTSDPDDNVPSWFDPANDDTIDRWVAAMAQNGFSTAHANQASHGLDH